MQWHSKYFLMIAFWQALYAAQAPHNQNSQTVKDVLNEQHNPSEPLSLLTPAEKNEYCKMYHCMCTENDPGTTFFRQMFKNEKDYLEFKAKEKEASLKLQAEIQAQQQTAAHVAYK